MCVFDHNDCYITLSTTC